MHPTTLKLKLTKLMHIPLSLIKCYNGNLLEHITKTRLYNFDPMKPHFYIVKLGFTGVYIIFLISAQNNLCFEQKYEKYQNFLSGNFPVFGL